jgi:general secretion pathway protein G
MALIKGTRPRARGFTLMELLVVMTVIALLASVGIVGYRHSLKVSKEAVLKENLFILRKLIDQYAQDKGKYPASIQALVQDSYLRTIPIDPMTRQSTTWVEVRELPSPQDPMLNEVPGVIDVKSGSEDKSPIDGSPYNAW